MKPLKIHNKQTENLFPKQHGHVPYSNLKVLNAMLFMLENGCKWRTLPRRFGKWNSSYRRVNLWAKDSVLVQVFESLQAEKFTTFGIEALFLDSTIIKVHPDGSGALKNEKQAIGKSRGGWTAKIHMLCATNVLLLLFIFLAGNAMMRLKDATFWKTPARLTRQPGLLMDRAYKGDNMRNMALRLSCCLCVPQKPNRQDTWGYDQQLYKQRNEIKRLFRRLKAFRRIFTRYDKLDCVFTAFICLTLVFDSFR